MKTPTGSFRGSRSLESRHPLLGAAPLADRLRSVPMSKAEADARAYATWRAIDAETDARDTIAKARRLADVARDIERARSAKARVSSVFSVLRYLAAVITRSWGAAEMEARA
jgi:hypothetical protein